MKLKGVLSVPKNKRSVFLREPLPLHLRRDIKELKVLENLQKAMHSLIFPRGLYTYNCIFQIFHLIFCRQ